MGELNRAEISERLKSSLQEAGLKYWEMAQLLEVSKRSIEDYVAPGLATIPWDRLDEWAEITGTTKYWLLHGVDRKVELDPALLATLVSRLDRVVGLLEAERQEAPLDG